MDFNRLVQQVKAGGPQCVVAELKRRALCGSRHKCHAGPRRARCVVLCLADGRLFARRADYIPQ